MGAIRIRIHRPIGQTQRGRAVSDRRWAIHRRRLDAESDASYFLRSPHAHAKIRAIDTAKAKKAPGVVAIYTGVDLDGVNGLHAAG